jgi:type III pantothenate kinase
MSRGVQRSRPRLLLLDVGNTRLKWALLGEVYRRGCRFRDSGAVPLSRLRGEGSVLRRLFARVSPSGAILVSNVAGPAVERRLLALARLSAAPRPRFLRTSRSAGGVRNAYRDPWRLGVDRWASLIGAHAEYPHRALCLVAVGTAMTIDLLDAKGAHRGGSIIPGPDLMVDALLERTAGIRHRAGGRSAAHDAHRVRGAAALFARSTRHAVAAGAVHAAAALVRESVQAGNRLLGRRPLLIVAGGGATAVIRVLHAAHRRQDDLALRGLAVLESARAHFA